MLTFDTVKKLRKFLTTFLFYAYMKKKVKPIFLTSSHIDTSLEHR